MVKRVRIFRKYLAIMIFIFIDRICARKVLIYQFSGKLRVGIHLFLRPYNIENSVVLKGLKKEMCKLLICMSGCNILGIYLVFIYNNPDIHIICRKILENICISLFLVENFQFSLHFQAWYLY